MQIRVLGIFGEGNIPPVRYTQVQNRFERISILHIMRFFAFNHKGWIGHKNSLIIKK